MVDYVKLLHHMNRGHFDSQQAYKELRERYNIHFVDLLIQKGFKTYLFGGSLRDMVLGKEWKDADIRAWIPLPAQERDQTMEAILKEANIEIKSKIIFNEKFTIYRFMPEGSAAQGVIDFTVVTKQFEVIPDFTVNGLYFDLETKELIDHHNALEDLEQKLIRTVLVPQEQFALEPQMIFRAVKCACQFNFNIEEQTLKAMCDKAGLIDGILSAVADNVFPGMTEWFISNMFRGLKYNPTLFVTLWHETQLDRVFINFVCKRLNLKPTDSNISAVFEAQKQYSYEDALSIFISAIAKNINSLETPKVFNQIINLMRINSPSVFDDFVVDNAKITFWKL